MSSDPDNPGTIAYERLYERMSERAHEELTEELGRKPTDEEWSDRTEELMNMELER